jgi:steroid delta-isomerase-like uncharacterized protein
MPEESNKEIVRKYVEAFNNGDIDALLPLFTDDAVVHGVLGWGKLAEVVPIWREIHEAFAIKMEVDAIIAEGDTVAVRYIERGTSVGSFRGGPITGRSFEVVAMEWFIFRSGRIQKRWGARDFASQSRQMGLPLS